jgi:subtilisin family serine protease
MVRFTGWYAIGFVMLFYRMALADSYSIGPKGINSAGLGLTGAGVRIGQVEQGRPGDAGNGDTAGNRNSTTNPFDVFIQNNPGNPMPDAEVRPHAQEVAGVMISTSMEDGTGVDDDGDMLDNDIAPTGVATGASLYSSAYVTEGTNPGYDDAIMTMQFIASIANMRAVNHSWGKEEVDFSNPNNGESQLTMAIDWSANRHNVLHLVAGNQGMTADTPAPKDNYNGMTIGRSAKAADGVYRRVSPNNNYSQDAFGDRTSIAIIAPGDDLELATINDANRITGGGTSYATPHVTGTVALLQQNAFTTHQRRHEVMKAVLMNSADKIKGIMGMERTVVKQDGVSTWLGSTADTHPGIPLDIEMGTGHLNASRALQQFQADEFDPGSVPPIGWDYNIQDDPFILNNYSFTLSAGDFVSATLVWD